MAPLPTLVPLSFFSPPLLSVSFTHAARFCPEKVASEGGEGMVQTEHLELAGKVLEEADVLYVTRIQRERFASEEVCPLFGSTMCVRNSGPQFVSIIWVDEFGPNFWVHDFIPFASVHDV